MDPTYKELPLRGSDKALVALMFSWGAETCSVW